MKLLQPSLALTGLIGALNAAEPELRVGIMTDTHIGRTEESCMKSRQAFELFKKHQVDMVVHLGDLADRHYPEGYAIYRRFFNEVFDRNKPREIYLYANHDRIGIKTKAGFTADMQKFRQALNIRNEICDRIEIKGYPFLIYPDYPGYPLDAPQLKDTRKAVKDYPGKPIFVLDHVPPFDTTSNSRVWGNTLRREVFDRFPQVIHISGHTHNSLRNEQCIWQGNFTAINAGCLSTWGGSLIGNTPDRKTSDEVLIMEVFPEKILFRRYSVTDGSEIRPDCPWCIPWPFDPKNAPYRPEYRRAHSPQPEFPAGSKIIAQTIGNPFREILFSFPEAFHPEGCYLYDAELEIKKGQNRYISVSRKEIFGQFYLTPEHRKKENRIRFSSSFFERGAEYRITVTPQDFYGNRGTPLRLLFKAGTPERGKITFETDDPMKFCIYSSKDSGWKPLMPGKNNFFQSPGYHTRLTFPEKCWDGPKGSRFRFILDLSLEQPENSNWTVVLQSLKTGNNVILHPLKVVLN